jgi:hypothetical protein
MCELDLRWRYEQQQNSMKHWVAPATREQPPFAPKHRLR